MAALSANQMSSWKFPEVIFIVITSCLVYKRGLQCFRARCPCWRLLFGPWPAAHTLELFRVKSFNGRHPLTLGFLNRLFLLLLFPHRACCSALWLRCTDYCQCISTITQGCLIRLVAIIHINSQWVDNGICFFY